MPDRLMVGHRPLKAVILVRVQVWQQVHDFKYSIPKGYLAVL